MADIGNVIRTGGPVVSRRCDLRSFSFRTTCWDRQTIMLLNHTGCGFTTFTDEELNAKLAAETGDSSPAPMPFYAYKDPVQHTREQIKKVRSHPWISKDVPVRGFVFDMETGLLSEVDALVDRKLLVDKRTVYRKHYVGVPSGWTPSMLVDAVHTSRFSIQHQGMRDLRAYGDPSVPDPGAMPHTARHRSHLLSE